MFYYLRGEITHIEAQFCVVDVSGAGYACHTSANSLSRMKTGETHTLYTHVHIREDLFDIYGFHTPDELACFRMLIGISGVGPKAALSILSASTPERLALAILTGDEKALTAASGVGKKLASRIVLELKDKMSKTESLAAVSQVVAPAEGGAANPLQDALSALAVLGYSPSQAALALSDFDTTGLPLEDIIRQALKRLSKL